MSDNLSFSIIQKTDDIPWSDVKNVILAAHQENMSRGLVVSTIGMNEEQLKNQIGEGVCFLAIKDSLESCSKTATIIGVAAIRMHNINTWYANGVTAHFIYGAVLPSYKGQGVYKALQKARYDYVSSLGVKCITTSTAEKNFRMREILKSQGFCPVRMFSVPGLNHYSIRWAKWLDKKPHSIWYIKARYLYSVLYAKMKNAKQAKDNK